MPVFQCLYKEKLNDSRDLSGFLFDILHLHLLRLQLDMDDLYVSGLLL